MDTVNPDTGGIRPSATEADRQRRIAWEAAGIAEARAQLDAGYYVDAEEVDAWIDSIGTDHELPRLRGAVADRAACAARADPRPSGPR